MFLFECFDSRNMKLVINEIEKIVIEANFGKFVGLNTSDQDIPI